MFPQLEQVRKSHFQQQFIENCNDIKKHGMASKNVINIKKGQTSSMFIADEMTIIAITWS